MCLLFPAIRISFSYLKAPKAKLIAGKNPDKIESSNQQKRSMTMAALIAYYSRAGENYFGGAHRRISVGNTEKAADMLATLTGGVLYKIEQAQPYSEDYNTCIAEAKADLQKMPARRYCTCRTAWRATTSSIWATPTTGAPCPWRSIPSLSTMTSPARPSIPSALTRAAAFPTPCRISKRPRRVPSSPAVLPSAAAA